MSYLDLTDLLTRFYIVMGAGLLIAVVVGVLSLGRFREATWLPGLGAMSSGLLVGIMARWVFTLSWVETLVFALIGVLAYGSYLNGARALSKWIRGSGD